MSDEETEPTPAADTTPAKGGAGRTTAPTNLLSRPTDAAARPGFRDPANRKSKATKKGRKKKR